MRADMIDEEERLKTDREQRAESRAAARCSAGWVGGVRRTAEEEHVPLAGHDRLLLEARRGVLLAELANGFVVLHLVVLALGIEVGADEQPAPVRAALHPDGAVARRGGLERHPGGDALGQLVLVCTAAATSDGRKQRVLQR